MANINFEVPNSPDEFSLNLAAASLRNIDFSGLDFETSRKAIYEYIKTYFPDQFNDFAASNGIVMLVEIVASVVAKLSLRSDLLANESTLPTAMSEEAVVNHLALINQKIRNATPATTAFEISLVNSAFTDVVIPAGVKLTTRGPNDTIIFYEIFKSPLDFTSDVIIPAGKKGIVAFGIEGETVASPLINSVGGINQIVNISGSNILDSPIVVNVDYGDTREQYTTIFEPIERYGPNDKVVEAEILSTGLSLKFGDNQAGVAPKVGSTISVSYRRGGGVRGRIGAFVIDTTRQYRPSPPASAPVSVRFRNITPSEGGLDRESLKSAKQRAPKDFSIQRSIVTAEDYSQSAKSFAHPTFGSVSKAIATVRTGINANMVDVYILSNGQTAPALPSVGLKLALQEHIDLLNMLTDIVTVKSGLLRPVDVEAVIVLNRNADAAVVKQKVEFAIDSFFALEFWEMGQPLYVSNLVDALQAIDGILYVDLIQPVNNILKSNLVQDAVVADKVGLNELITAGNKNISYYYEKTI